MWALGLLEFGTPLLTAPQRRAVHPEAKARTHAYDEEPAGGLRGQDWRGRRGYTLAGRHRDGGRLTRVAVTLWCVRLSDHDLASESFIDP